MSKADAQDYDRFMLFFLGIDLLKRLEVVFVIENPMIRYRR